jgi:hypothetical protein
MTQFVVTPDMDVSDVSVGLNISLDAASRILEQMNKEVETEAEPMTEEAQSGCVGPIVVSCS